MEKFIYAIILLASIVFTIILWDNPPLLVGKDPHWIWICGRISLVGVILWIGYRMFLKPSSKK